jgi:hypothetical protein
VPRFRFTSQTAAAFGRRGGLATFRKHAIEHMRAIGRRGFEVTTNLHFDGDKRKHLNALIRRGLMAIDPCPWNGSWQAYQAFPNAPKESNP